MADRGARPQADHIGSSISTQRSKGAKPQGGRSRKLKAEPDDSDYADKKALPKADPELPVDLRKADQLLMTSGDLVFGLIQDLESFASLLASHFALRISDGTDPA